MKQYSIVTLNKKNITDFAQARNKLLNKSKTDWVFFLDSDEVVSDDLKNQIPKLLQYNSRNCYYVYRKNYFLGEYAGTDKIIRLVRKGSGKWVRAVHEVFTPNESHLAGVINTPIVHNTADNLSEYINRINVYSSLHAKANKKEGKRPTLFKIIIYPIGKLLITFLKSGNIVFSIMQSFHSFLAWSKQRLYEKKI